MLIITVCIRREFHLCTRPVFWLGFVRLCKPCFFGDKKKCVCLNTSKTVWSSQPSIIMISCLLSPGIPHLKFTCVVSRPYKRRSSNEFSPFAQGRRLWQCPSRGLITWLGTQSFQLITRVTRLPIDHTECRSSDDEFSPSRTGSLIQPRIPVPQVPSCCIHPRMLETQIPSSRTQPGMLGTQFLLTRV